MKNKHGMVRSAEFLKANPAHSKSGAGPEVQHMRVSKHEDGVKVTHHAHPSAAAHATHHMGHDELGAHVAEHFGLDKGSPSEEPDGISPVGEEEEY